MKVTRALAISILLTSPLLSTAFQRVKDIFGSKSKKALESSTPARSSSTRHLLREDEDFHSGSWSGHDHLSARTNISPEESKNIEEWVDNVYNYDSSLYGEPQSLVWLKGASGIADPRLLTENQFLHTLLTKYDTQLERQLSQQPSQIDAEFTNLIQQATYKLSELPAHSNEDLVTIAAYFRALVAITGGRPREDEFHTQIKSLIEPLRQKVKRLLNRNSRVENLMRAFEAMGEDPLESK